MCFLIMSHSVVLGRVARDVSMDMIFIMCHLEEKSWEHIATSDAISHS